MQRLIELWREAKRWASKPDPRLTEYLLIGAYSGVAILCLIVGITAKAGTLFGRALQDNNYGARPELKAMAKQLMTAGADFSSGASLLVVAAVIVYWGRRVKKTERELPVTLPSGPPFLL